jgi:AcrR family transcriptional regulator
MTIHEAEFSLRKQPVQDRSAVTVEAILEATIRILERAGGGSFTTREVAEMAGVSVGSLYQYFPNKQALVSELLRRRLDHLVAVARKACASAPLEPRASIAHVIGAIIAEKQRHEQWWRALKAVMGTVDVQPLVRQRTADIHDAVGELIETRLGRALDAGERGRLVIAIDAAEGALSRMVKITPERLWEEGTAATFVRLFIATLALPEIGGAA